MSESNWESILKKAAAKAKAQEVHHKNVVEKFVDVLKKVLTFELFIGLLAAFVLYLYFGWEALFKTFLSWIIGITMVSTIITIMIDKYKKILHLKH